MGERTFEGVAIKRVPSGSQVLLIGVTAPTTAKTFLGEYFHRAAEREWNVALISGPDRELSDMLLRDGVQFRPVSMAREPSFIRDCISLLAVYRVIRSVRPDVVVYATPKASLLLSVAAFACRIPVRIYEQWGLRLETVHGFRRAILWVLEWLTCALSTKVVANSPSLLSRLRSLRLVRRKKSVCLGAGSSHGVEWRRFDGLPRTSEALEDSSGSMPLRFGFVGRLHPDKGIGVMVDGLNLCHRRGIAVQAVLAGPEEGVDPQELSQLAEFPLEWLGPVDDPREVYSRIDALVLLSEREGFPNVVLEAAAAGVPAIVSDSTGTVDSVLDGETGTIIPTGDSKAFAECVERVAAEPTLLRSWGEKARLRVRSTFDHATVTDAHLDFYAES